MNHVAIQTRYTARRTQGTSTITTNQWTLRRELDAVHRHKHTRRTYRWHCAIIALLGLYAPWNGNFLPTFREQPIGPIFKSQVQEMGQTGCLETSVRNYHSAVRQTPGEGRSNLQRYESLRSRKTMFLVLNLTPHADRPNKFKQRFPNFPGSRRP